jgi:hypothetical protein
VALVLFMMLVVVVRSRPRYAMAPWMGNTLSYNGVMDGAELSGIRPTAMPKIVRILSAVVVFAVACILIADLLIWLTRPFQAYRKTRDFLLFPKPNEVVIPAMMLFGLAYLTLLLPRCATNMVYDRYMLPLMPCVLFPILLAYQKHGEEKVPAFALTLLGIYTLYAIAITQDITSLARARATAYNRLVAGGISRTQIDAGFECDCQTQLDLKGYINDPRIQIPKGAYKPNMDSTYVVQPSYRLEHQPAIDTATTRFGSVPYFSLLYPFHRAVYIDQYVDPWWLNPRKAATRPAEKVHHFIPPAGLPEDDEKKPQ